MPSFRLTAMLWAFSSIVSCNPVQAVEPGRDPGQVADPEGTASVTLGTLSVKPLAVDRPWDPHVCIGCDRNNGSPFDRKVRLSHRVRRETWR